MLLCLQEWESRDGSAKFAEELKMDIRGLRFARDVRSQLSLIAGPQGTSLLPEPVFLEAGD